MRSIDVHAHLTPPCFWQATEKGGGPYLQSSTETVFAYVAPMMRQ